MRRGSKPRVVIAGGGVAALETMLSLRDLAGDLVAIELVAPGREFLYRPLAVAEPFGLGRAHRFDLETLAACAGAELVTARVVGVDPSARAAITDDGRRLRYDVLVLAPGACPRLALRGATTFWGIADSAQIASLLSGLETGEVESVAFAAHSGSGWQLPLYELALLTASRLDRDRVSGRRLTLVTHEAEPLELFGPHASTRIRALFEERGIELVCDREPTAVRRGELELESAGSVAADRVVTLPRLDGPELAGVPSDERGFIPVDGFGRVPGLADLYAAGDATSFGLKQGGLAAQQAHTVASAIAAAAGAEVESVPFRPILRGLLRTAGAPQLMRTALRDEVAEPEALHPEALWWPPGRIVGGRLTPYLATIAGESIEPPAPGDGDSIEVEVELSLEAA